MDLVVFWTNIERDLFILGISLGLIAVALVVIAWQKIVQNKLLLNLDRYRKERTNFIWKTPTHINCRCKLEPIDPQE